MQNAKLNAEGKTQSVKQEQKSSDLSVRTKEFALSVIVLFKELPFSEEARILGRQLLRSGTSIGAQYREAKRARSKAEFLSKMEAALQELEETGYWLELLGDAKIVSMERLKSLYQENKELMAMFVASINTAKQ